MAENIKKETPHENSTENNLKIKDPVSVYNHPDELMQRNVDSF